MKTLATITIAAIAAMSLGACMGSYGYHDGYVGGDYVDGYYDDFYGPTDAGYWGSDGVFMYRGGDHQYHRDDAGHFHKEAAQGAHPIHVHAGHPDAGHSEGGHPDHG
jgi:hypothetical protein